MSAKGRVGRTLIVVAQHFMLLVLHPPLLVGVAAPSVIARNVTTDKTTVDLKTRANISTGRASKHRARAVDDEVKEPGEWCSGKGVRFYTLADTVCALFCFHLLVPKTKRNVPKKTTVRPGRLFIIAKKSHL